jgi:hypothetical protein
MGVARKLEVEVEVADKVGALRWVAFVLA